MGTAPSASPEPAATCRTRPIWYRLSFQPSKRTHSPYFHNGIAPTLEAVVELYNTKKSLSLTAQQKADLVRYLKSL